MTAAAIASDVVAVSAQIACVIAVAALLARGIRVDAAAVRYQYWRGGLFLCVVLPWVQRRQATASAVETIATIAFPATQSVAFAGASGVSATASLMPWIAIAGWIVLAGIAIRLARVGYGIVRLRAVRRSGQLAPASADHDELQRALGTRAEIRYVRNGHPVTCGLWRPVVLLPEHLTSHPSEIQRAVLAHELLHVKRRDWMWVIGEEVLRSVLWFHPGIWWLVGRVRLAREEAVDELTVCLTGRRRTYLEALLAFADAAPFASGAAFARRRHLFRRMTLISKEAAMSSKRIAVSCVVLALGVAAGSWYALRAFPLMAQAQGVQSGPLEQNAKPITPENPIPRRTYSVSPQYPAGAAGDSAFVMLRVTIDALGRVGEVRPDGFFAGPVLEVEDAKLLARFGGSNRTSVPSSSVFVKSAADAVRQWVYEPPAEAPVSFDVAFLFAPGSETRMLAHGVLGIERGAAAPTTAEFPASQPAPPPPPPAPPAPWIRDGVAITNAVHIGGDVKAPVKINDVKAVYPPAAMAAHLEGTVVLEAIVGIDGRVDEVRVLNGVPMLDQAAMDATKEWKFTPGTVNGVPVPVIVTINLTFTLK